MRDDLYEHLQRLDPASTTPGSPASCCPGRPPTCRRSAGSPASASCSSSPTSGRSWSIIALLIRLNWWLGLLTGWRVPARGRAVPRFEKRYRVLSRRVQDQQGDLATYVEEAADRHPGAQGAGPPRRGRRPALRPGHGWSTGTQVDKARLRGTFWAGLDLVPNAVIGLILLLGALAVSRHELTLGGLVAFITLALLLVWPIEAMGYIIAGGQEAATAAQRVYEIFDTSRRHRRPALADARPAPVRAPSGRAAAGRARAGPAARSRPPVRAPGASTRSAFTLPGGAARRCCAGSRLELEPGETVALVGATGSGKTTLLQLVPRLADVTGGADPAGRHRHPRPAAGRAARRGWAARSRTPRCSRPASGRTSASACPDAERGRRPGRPGRGPGRLRGRPAVGPGHQDRRAGHGAVRRPAAAGRAGPGHPGPAAGAAAGRPAVRAGRAHRGQGHPRRSAGCWPCPPRWWWRTGRPPCCWPTGWRCWPRRHRRRSARTTSCSPREPRYRDLMSADGLT